MGHKPVTHSAADLLLQAVRQIDACARSFQASAEALQNESYGGLLRDRAMHWDAVGTRLRRLTGSAGSALDLTQCPLARLARTRIRLNAWANDLTSVLQECRWNEALARKYCALLLSRTETGDFARELRTMLPPHALEPRGIGVNTKRDTPNVDCAP